MTDPTKGLHNYRVEYTRCSAYWVLQDLIYNVGAKLVREAVDQICEDTGYCEVCEELKASGKWPEPETEDEKFARLAATQQPCIVVVDQADAEKFEGLLKKVSAIRPASNEKERTMTAINSGTRPGIEATTSVIDLSLQEQDEQLGHLEEKVKMLSERLEKIKGNPVPVPVDAVKSPGADVAQSEVANRIIGVTYRIANLTRELSDCIDRLQL